MDEMIEKLVLKLERSKNDVQAFFESIDEKNWDRIVYPTDSSEPWQIQDIFSHLIISEESFLVLFNQMCAGREIIQNTINIDQFNAEHQKQFDSISKEEVINRFLVSRQNMIQFVMKISQKELSIVGDHPALGISKLEDMIKLIPIHDQMHMKDIKKILTSE